MAEIQQQNSHLWNILSYILQDANHKLVLLAIYLQTSSHGMLGSQLINSSFRNTCHEVCISVSTGIQICVVRFRLGESFQQQQLHANVKVLTYNV